MNNARFLLFFAFFSFLLVNSQAQNADSLAVLTRSKERIAIFCADSLAGRGYVNNGHLNAARYIAKNFRQAGLQPLPPAERLEGYFQPFEFDINLIRSAKLSFDEKPLKMAVDYLPHPYTGSGDGDLKIIDADPLFVNFTRQNLSLIKTDGGLGSDKHLNQLNGKMAVLSDDALALKLDTVTKYLKLDRKMGLAIEYGAKGLLILTDKLTASFAPQAYPVPVFYLQKDAYLARKDAKKALFSVKAKEQPIVSQNVIGIVRGTQYPDSAVILCAHYDHIGQIDETIFYGANDNASGSAFLLALAEQIAQKPLPYSVIFIAFSAEETGLNGSMYYARHPAFPLKQTKFVLNFDLIGNGHEGVMAVAGKDFPQLYQPFVQLNDSLKWLTKVAMRPNAANSDHYPFVLKGVPALFFYTLGGSTCYHDPCDKPDVIHLPIFYRFSQMIVRYLEGMR